MNRFMGVLLLLTGLLAVLGGVTRWEWFLTHRKAAPVVALPGGPGVRRVPGGFAAYGGDEGVVTCPCCWSWPLAAPCCWC
jgi:hypothetical protein